MLMNLKYSKSGTRAVEYKKKEKNIVIDMHECILTIVVTSNIFFILS